MIWNEENVQETIKVIVEQLHILWSIHSYLASLRMSMAEVLLYKSMTLHAKLIQFLMDLLDFLGQRIKKKGFS